MKHASQLHVCKNSATQGKPLVAVNPPRLDGRQQSALGQRRRRYCCSRSPSNHRAECGSRHRLRLKLEFCCKSESSRNDASKILCLRLCAFGRSIQFSQVSFTILISATLSYCTGISLASCLKSLAERAGLIINRGHGQRLSGSKLPIIGSSVSLSELDNSKDSYFEPKPCHTITSSVTFPTRRVTTSMRKNSRIQPFLSGV